MSTDKVVRYRLRETLLGVKRHYKCVRIVDHRYKPRFDRDGYLNVGMQWLVKHMPDVAVAIVTRRLTGQPLVPASKITTRLNVNGTTIDER